MANGAVMNFVSKTLGMDFRNMCFEDVPAQSNYALESHPAGNLLWEAMPGYRSFRRASRNSTTQRATTMFTRAMPARAVSVKTTFETGFCRMDKADINILSDFLSHAGEQNSDSPKRS